jgi:hypothetical protein
VVSGTNRLVIMVPSSTSNNTSTFIQRISLQTQSGGNGWSYLQIPENAYGIYKIVGYQKFTGSTTTGSTITGYISFATDASASSVSYTSDLSSLNLTNTSYYSTSSIYSTSSLFYTNTTLVTNGTLNYNSVNKIRNIFLSYSTANNIYLDPVRNDVFQAYVSITKVG